MTDPFFKSFAATAFLPTLIGPSTTLIADRVSASPINTTVVDNLREDCILSISSIESPHTKVTANRCSIATNILFVMIVLVCVAGDLPESRSYPWMG